MGQGCAAATGVHVGGDATLDASSLADSGTIRCGNSVLDPGEQCDDGNTVPGDGCNETCHFEDCSPISCPTGCCNATGHCVAGTQDTACGSGAAPCVSCADTAQICQDHACQEASHCTGGEILACGNCGDRTCSAEGIWGPCEHQGTCSPDAVEVTGSCGQCGTLQHTCRPDCTWSDLSCVNQGPCAPGQLQQGASCGQCAHEERECGEDCTWGSWTCVNQSECTPGQVHNGASCGNCGTLQRTCQSNCTWSTETCVDEGVCSPGTQQDCNECGSRTCANDCTWSDCQGTRSCPGAATCDSQGWCQSPCGNGVCDVGEDKFNCVGDCPTFWCDTNTAVNNMCHFPPNSPGLPMTYPGGYCDPNGDGDYSDGDWVAGWTEYCTVRCQGNPGC